MSDTERKNVSDQVEEKVTPESQKSTLDQVREVVAGLYDRAAAVVTPNSNDSIRETTDKVSEKGQEAMDAVKKPVDKAGQPSSNAPSDTK